MACLVILLLFALIQWLLVPDEEEGKYLCHCDTAELELVKKGILEAAPCSFYFVCLVTLLRFLQNCLFSSEKFFPEQ